MKTQTLTDQRAGEIARSLIEYKYRRNGFNFEREDLKQWIQSKSKRTGINPEVLGTYVTQVILPCALRTLGNINVTMAPKHESLNKDAIGSISMALVYTEFSFDSCQITERIDALVRDGVDASREELVLIITNYLIPEFVKRLTNADKVTISWTEKVKQ